MDYAKLRAQHDKMQERKTATKPAAPVTPTEPEKQPSGTMAFLRRSAMAAATMGGSEAWRSMPKGVQDVVRGIGQSMARPATASVAGVVAGVTGKDVDWNGWGSASNDPEKQARIAGGAALEAAAFLPAGRGLQALRGLGKGAKLGKLALAESAYGAVTGAAGSAGSTLSTEEDATAGDMIKSGLTGAAIGGVLGAALPLAGSAISRLKSKSPYVREMGEQLDAHVAAGKGPDGGGGVGEIIPPSPTVVPFNDKAKAKLKDSAGFEDWQVKLIDDANNEERKALLNMMDSSDVVSKDRMSKSHPTQAMGGALVERLGTVKATLKKSTAEIDDEIAKMPKSPVSVQSAVDDFTDTLDGLGVRISQGGTLSFSKSALSGPANANTRKLLQFAYGQVRPNLRGQALRTPERIRQIRKALRLETLAETKQAIPGPMTAIVNTLRDGLDQPLREMSERYRIAARTTAMSLDAVKEFYSKIGLKYKFTEDEILNMRTGEVANRLLGNASADVERVIGLMDDVLEMTGQVPKTDIRRLAFFNKMVEDLYGITQPRSLEGAIQSGTGKAISAAGDVAEAIASPKGAVLKYVSGLGKISPEKRRRVLREVLEGSTFGQVMEKETAQAAAGAIPKVADDIAEAVPKASEVAAPMTTVDNVFTAASGSDTIADEAYRAIRKDGGVTISLKGDRPTEGFAFAPYKGTETVVPSTDFNANNVDEFKKKYHNELMQEGNHVGIWEDGGNVYMDVSRVGPPTPETFQVAHDADQLAVFDLKNQKTLYTKHSPQYEEASVSHLYAGKDGGTIDQGGMGGVSKVPEGREGSVGKNGKGESTPEGSIIVPKEIKALKSFGDGKPTPEVAKAVSDFAKKHLTENIDEITTDLLAKPGLKVIDSDVIKRLIPGVDDDLMKNPELNRVLQDAAGEAADMVYEKALKEATTPYVTFTAGGSGSGKSEIITNALRGLGYDDVVVDGTLKTWANAEKKIDAAFAAGKKVTIEYPLVDEDVSWNFVQKRAAKGGHAVPEEVFRAAHKGAKDSILKAIEKYGDKIKIRVTDVRGLSLDAAKAKRTAGGYIKDAIEIKKALAGDGGTSTLKREGMGVMAGGMKIMKNKTTKGALDEVFEGLQDLTTKTLERLKGRSTVSKQFISDLTNTPDLRQTERDLLRNILETEKDVIDVPAFAKKVEAELLPLERNMLDTPYGESAKPRHESSSLPPESRGEVRDYTEYIYKSPIQTSAGNVHFGHSKSAKNYFGHTRVEDMADGKTRRVIEVQSDLYQKGGLEKHAEFFDDPMKKKQQVESEYGEHQKELQKLQRYNDPTAHFRMIREEVKKAADDDMTTLQFPTGETAMRVQRLDNDNLWTIVTDESDFAPIMERKELKPGTRMNKFLGYDEPGETDMIITEVLEDGKVKLVPEDKYAPGSDMSRFEETEDLFLGGIDTSNPIYRFYDKEVGKYLRSKYGATQVTDKQGVSWWQVDVKPEHKGPVEAFGLIPAGAVGLAASEKRDE